MQKHDHGERPIAFISRALTGAECNYSMWEKELVCSGMVYQILPSILIKS